MLDLNKQRSESVLRLRCIEYNRIPENAIEFSIIVKKKTVIHLKCSIWNYRVLDNLASFTTSRTFPKNKKINTLPFLHERQE